MGTRLDFQTLLESLQEGVHVYFQPPVSTEFQTPAIVYNRDDIFTEFADNQVYSATVRYLVTVIDKNPDSLLPGLIAGMPMSKYVRHYTSMNLNYDVLDVYF